MGACTSSNGVHPDHDDLPGQQYLGRCWKLLSTEDPAWLESVPAWSRTSNGELPSRGFHFVLATDPETKAPIRTPYFNKSTKSVNGYYAPGLHCDFDGLENNTQVFADSDIKTSTKTALKFSVGVGLGTAEASVGAQRKEKHGTGESDYYVIVTIETYRLSVDLSRMFYSSVDSDPFSETNFLANSTSAQQPQASTGTAAAPGSPTANNAAATSTTSGNNSTAKFIRHTVDQNDPDAYGHGCVTQVKCGGQLLIRIKQTNYGDQLKAWGASISAGIRAGVPTVGASGQKKKKGGDLRLDVEVHHAGGPEVPTQFQNCTLDDIESMVETWSKGLVNNVLLAVPLRVGVHRYAELKGQLFFSPLNHSQRSFQSATLQEENEELKRRVAELERQLEGAQASLVSAPDPNETTLRQSSEPNLAASFSDTESVVAAVVVPPTPGESSSVTKNRMAVAGYIGRCVTGQICEVDFSQVPDAEEAALWAAISLHRYPTVVKAIRLSGCRAADRAATNVACVLRFSTAMQVLCRLDMTDNNITAVGAIELVQAAVTRAKEGGSKVDIYLDNNQGLEEESRSNARFAAVLKEASLCGITVSI